MADGMIGKVRLCVFIVLASQAVYSIFDYLKKSLESNRENQTEGIKKSEVLFFPDKKIACRQFLSDGGCSRDRCSYAHEVTSLSRLIDVLIKARRTLDVCVFTINCFELADAVIQMHKRGVVVRVLTDSEQIGSSGSQIEKFRREGIQVRNDLSSFFMHHKFAIVDGEVLANGSFNWTRQAVTGNRENVVITYERELVRKFSQEFNKLWEEYDPSKR